MPVSWKFEASCKAKLVGGTIKDFSCSGIVEGSQTEAESKAKAAVEAAVSAANGQITTNIDVHVTQESGDDKPEDGNNP